MERRGCRDRRDYPEVEEDLAETRNLEAEMDCLCRDRRDRRGLLDRWVRQVRKLIGLGLGCLCLTELCN